MFFVVYFSQTNTKLDIVDYQVTVNKHIIEKEFIGIRAFLNTGNKDYSINRSTGNTYETRFLTTDESFTFGEKLGISLSFDQSPPPIMLPALNVIISKRLLK